MKNLRKIYFPHFLQKIDTFLLEKYPIIWSTKIHLVAFYSTLVTNIFLVLIAFLVPVSKNYIPDYQNFTSHSFFYGFLFFVFVMFFYVYHQRQTPIKIFTLKQNLLRFGLYWIAILSFTLNVFIVPLVVVQRVKNLYTTKDIENDLNYITKIQFIKKLSVFDSYLAEEEDNKIMLQSLKNIFGENKEFQEFNNNIKILKDFLRPSDELLKINKEIKLLEIKQQTTGEELREKEVSKINELQEKFLIELKEKRYNAQKLPFIASLKKQINDFINEIIANHEKDYEKRDYNCKSYIENKTWIDVLENINFEFFSKKYTDFYAKYPLSEDHAINKKISKINKYVNGSFFASNPELIELRFDESKRLDFAKRLYKKYLLEKKGIEFTKIYELNYNFIRDFCSEEFTLGWISNYEKDDFIFQGKDRKINIFSMLLSEISFDNFIEKSNKKTLYNKHFKPEALWHTGLLMSGLLALVLLISPTFHFKTLFVSALSILILSPFHFVVFFALNHWEVLKNIVKKMYVFFEVTAENVEDTTFFLSNFYIVLTIFTGITLRILARKKTMNVEFFRVFWSFLMIMMVYLGFLGNLSMLSNFEGWQNLYFDAALNTKITLIFYSILVLFVFGMYQFYNNLLRLPQNNGFEVSWTNGKNILQNIGKTFKKLRILPTSLEKTNIKIPYLEALQERTKFLFYPQFLRNFDSYLLQNYPIIWQTKAHIFLFYSGVVANLILVAVVFCVPISIQKLPDFHSLISYNFFYGIFCLVFVLLFYVYNQSNGSIKVFTLKENILRLGLYILVVSSLVINLLLMPSLLIWRVQNVYSLKKINEDYTYIQKMQIAKNLLIFSYHSINKEKYISILQKSDLNKHNEIDDMLKGIQKIEKVFEKNKSFTSKNTDLDSLAEVYCEKLRKENNTTLKSKFCRVRFNDSIQKLNDKNFLSVINFIKNSNFHYKIKNQLSKTLKKII